jgi:bifunctional UDP-N-acetylglucosamine pyrophosphorylase/glucosamine-1-phosphate N-acetyltransferase
VIPFTAVVMAAGQGTRMRSATPKVLHEICGRPMVAWPVQAAIEAGAERVVVVTSPNIDLAPALPDGALTATQPEPNGTGGAVVAALPDTTPGQPVVVINGDVPLVSPEVLTELVTAHSDARASATLVTTELDDPTGYGRAVRGPDGRLTAIVETKRAEDATPETLAIREVNAGVYCFDHQALTHALPRLTTDNAQGELYLTQIVDLLHADGATVIAHEVADTAVVLGINDRVHLADVQALAQRRINEAHMRAGVTLVDPATAYIDADVTIGRDTRIEPGTQLKGATTVGERSTIGPNTTIIDSTIGDDATLVNAYAVGATLDAGAQAGPFAYLRPGTHLRADAKVGTFVEVKNSDIGEGTKVPHLSYIGDADVGPRTNLGASTITANYNGKTKQKSRTTIGADVKVSVHTSLVAPVELGDRAYTAAGSVVTDDVPEAALAVARARQKNIEGYADRD